MHAPVLSPNSPTYCWPPSLFPVIIPIQVPEKILHNCRNKISFTSICPLFFFPLPRTEWRGPELLLCIVMRLLPPWWGSKVGWQLFLKPDWARSIQGRLFFPAVSPSPVCKQLYSSLPLFSLSASLVRRQETKLGSITKSSKAIWSPVSASRPQHKGGVVRKITVDSAARNLHTKKTRRIYLTDDDDVAVHL